MIGKGLIKFVQPKMVAILIAAGVVIFSASAKADRKIWAGHVVIQKTSTAPYAIDGANAEGALLEYLRVVKMGSRSGVYCLIVCGSSCNYYGGGRTSQGPAHEADVECYKEYYYR